MASLGPVEPDVWTLFAGAAARATAASAVVDGARRVGYAELGRRVGGRLAALRSAGVEPGDRVALLASNGLAFLEATFAVAGAGAVLVPLNHRLAVPEVVAILADAGPRLLIAAREHAELAAAAGGCARAWLEDEPPPAAPRATPAPPSAPAFLYYTSGTTGLPKGVVLTHENVCVHAAAAIAELGLGAAERWGHVAPMFHLADAWATLAVTQVGGLHVMAPRFDEEAVLALFAREAVTLTNLVPTMLGRLVVHLEAMPAGERPRLGLRRILSGGAPIAPGLVRRAGRAFGCEYVQTYGMTETSPFLTVSLLHEHLAALPEEQALRYRARTGRPFATVELEVVADDGTPVQRDDRSVGEIRVRGRTVSPGYWNAPEETAAAFRDGWLYTGDLAVVDGEGYVDIVDRKKDMILTGGENVYSTEVEHALAEHPSVLEAAAFGLPDDRWGEAVHAAVAPRPGATIAVDELLAHCRARLAGYKVPRTIAVLPELPKTGSGKIAKRLLRRGRGD